ncbi:MAG: hypothetical protein M3541_08055 [Acidobacteriota bacterium]|nr:hypothetical protein [Acidobacteriota bacterium]
MVPRAASALALAATAAAAEKSIATSASGQLSGRPTFALVTIPVTSTP